MPIETRDCTLSKAQTDAIERGLTRIGAEESLVIVTTDLQASVREHFSHDDRYASYSTVRGGGQVAAKTVTHSSGPAIFVDHDLFNSATLEDNERLLAHEGGHVVAERRQEEFVSRHHMAGTQEEYDMLAAIGIAIEEFRIERELAGMGYAEGPMGHLDSMGWMLHTMSIDLLAALLDPEAGASPTVLREKVTSVLADFSKVLGYAAGPVVAKHGGVFPLNRLDDHGVANWDDYVGDHWVTLVNVLSDIPGIGTPMTADEIESALATALDWYRQWMEHVGFTLTVVPDGVSFVRTSPDELWTTRLQRATAEDAFRQSQAAEG